MGRINPPGVMEVWWASTIADPAAPTTTELNAGVDLTSFCRGVPTIPDTGNTAPIDNLASKFNPRIAASRGGDDIAIDLYVDDATDTAYDTFAPNTKGFLVVARHGLATSSTWAVGDKVWVYPAEVIARPFGVPGRDEADFIEAKLAITAPPTEKFTLAV